MQSDVPRHGPPAACGVARRRGRVVSAMLCRARLHTVVLPVANLDASRRWYAHCRLGSEVLYDPVSRLIVLELDGGTHIALVEAAAAPAAPVGSYVVLAVPDAGAVRAQLESRDIAVGPLATRGRTRVFEFADPDGHRFEVSDLPARR
jgi:catechol 2,3-dioxygenase-like lactoylglutathione lyase family enzyme